MLALFILHCVFHKYLMHYLCTLVFVLSFWCFLVTSNSNIQQRFKFYLISIQIQSSLNSSLFNTQSKQQLHCSKWVIKSTAPYCLLLVCIFDQISQRTIDSHLHRAHTKKENPWSTEKKTEIHSVDALCYYGLLALLQSLNSPFHSY